MNTRLTQGTWPWLRNFWYAVAREESLSPKKPLSITVLGQKLALFLNEQGNPVAVHDLCPHWGALLSGGTVENGQIVCPYHKFSFAADGHCKSVPGLDCQKIPNSMAVDSYPVEKKYGLIWVYLGELSADSRLSVVNIPEFEDPKLFNSVTSELRWQTSLGVAVENLLDFTHFSTLHANSFGDPAFLPNSDYKVKEGYLEVTANILVQLAENNGIFPPTPELGSNTPIEFISRFCMPSLVINTLKLGAHQNTTLWAFTPQDEKTVIAFSTGVRNYQEGSGSSEHLKKLADIIYAEDLSVMTSAVPEALPHSVPVPADLYVLKCRNAYKSCSKFPYRIIDDDCYRPTRLGTLTVIPSPARLHNQALDAYWKQ